jgi:hypothetical protein
MDGSAHEHFTSVLLADYPSDCSIRLHVGSQFGCKHASGCNRMLYFRAVVASTKRHCSAVLQSRSTAVAEFTLKLQATTLVAAMVVTRLTILSAHDWWPSRRKQTHRYADQRSRVW